MFQRQFARITAALTLAVAAAHASAGPKSNLYWLAGEIRGQMAVIRAQADATFRGCREADDVYDELEDLCRRMDRLEERLACPIESRADLRRLARAAERVDRQACELDEAIEHALRRVRRGVGPAFGPGIGPGLGPAPVLPPRHVDARQFGYRSPVGVANRSVFRMNLGGLSIGVCDQGRLQVGSAGPGFQQRGVARTVGFGHPALATSRGFHDQARFGHVRPNHARQNHVQPIGWDGDAQAAALCRQMDRLRRLTGTLANALGA
ncbi:MAG: hypothetical protein AAFV43_00245 [Planctomycetota bacterium]